MYKYFSQSIFAIIFTLVSWSSASTSMNGLHVSGNKILNGNNEVVQLRGVNRPGAEYSCIQYNKIFDGPSDQASIDAMKSWKINSVRVPVNEDCWLGTGGVNSSFGGDNYINPIVSYVNLLTSNGLAVIFDLHWSSSSPGTTASHQQTPMPNRLQSTPFWGKVADTFKNNLAVIFDVFNEPFPDKNAWNSDTAWKCWKNGGSECPGMNYTAAGMQELVDAIRNTGARNIIMVGGIQYATSVVRWNEYKPVDATGNLAAAIHVYDFNLCRSRGCWDMFWKPVMAEVPLIAGELGESDCATAFIDDFMNYADNFGISYLAWAWLPADCGAGPSLISDYSGTPTNYGIGLKRHLTQLDNGQVDPFDKSFYVYEDDRSHWMDNWSWGNGSLNLQATTVKHSGSYSMSYLPEIDTGIYLQCWGCFDTNQYKGIELWVHGGPTGGQHIRVTFVTIPDKSLIPETLSTTTKGPSFLMNSTNFVAGSWTQVYIDFATVLEAGNAYDGIQIESAVANEGIMYFDDILVLANGRDQSTSAPTSIPTSAPTPIPTSTPTTTPTSTSSPTPNISSGEILRVGFVSSALLAIILLAF